jgi:predicted nucleic acid-binding protein
MIAIINASPLIYLAQIGALKLLPKLFSKCYTTSIVKDEILNQKDAIEYTILEESFSDWLSVKESSDQKLLKRLEELQIHRGEASIITLAKELHDKEKENILIIDDLAAREIARTLGLKITGTLGIILKALRLSFITKIECKNYIQFLVENTTFRITTTLYSKILKEIDDFNASK